MIVYSVIFMYETFVYEIIVYILCVKVALLHFIQKDIAHNFAQRCK